MYTAWVSVGVSCILQWVSVGVHCILMWVSVSNLGNVICFSSVFLRESSLVASLPKFPKRYPGAKDLSKWLLVRTKEKRAKPWIKKTRTHIQ